MRINDMTSWLAPGVGPAGGGINDARLPRTSGEVRIGRTDGVQVDAAREGAGQSSPAVTPDAPVPTETRAERVARVRELVASGKPVDLAKLADTLLGTGIFFDERA